MHTRNMGHPRKEAGNVSNECLTVTLWSVIGDVTQSIVRLTRFCIFTPNKFVSEAEQQVKKGFFVLEKYEKSKFITLKIKWVMVNQTCPY